MAKKKRDIAAWKDNAVRLGIFTKLSEAEQKYGIPNGMLTGLAEQESDHFDPAVISGKRKSSAGAIGLMQFMPATAKGRKVNPLDLDSAIDGGAKYLKELHDQMGSWDGALTSYNWGPGNYRKWLDGKKKSIPTEARNYAPIVRKRAKTYGTLIAQAPQESTPKQKGRNHKNLLSGQQVVSQATPPPILSTPLSIPGPNSAEDSRNLLRSIAPPDMLSPPAVPTATVQTPSGSMGVVPQNPLEQNLVTQLTNSRELGLLAQVPELMEARNGIKNKPLIANRNDEFDKLLGDLIDQA